MRKSDLKDYKKGLRTAISRAKSAARKDILRDYLREVEKAERLQTKLSKEIGVDPSDIEIVPVKYIRNIKGGSAKALARQERDIRITARDIEKQAEREIEALKHKFEVIESDTRGARLDGVHIWERPGSDYSGRAARMIEANAQDLDMIIDNAVSRLGAIEVSKRLNNLYGSELEYELERIAYGVYDPVYRRMASGAASWKAAISRLKDTLE